MVSMSAELWELQEGSQIGMKSDNPVWDEREMVCAGVELWDGSL